MPRLKRLFIVPDTHVPFHDKKAWALCLKAIRHFKPDILVVLGDFADFFSVSSHSKSPARKNNLQWEVEQVKREIVRLENATPDYCRLIFIAGNHENRLERYLADKAPELYGLIKIPELLELYEWEYVKYRDHIKIGKLYITHDTGVAGATAHEKARNDFGTNTIIGHTHRMSVSYRGAIKGAAHVGAMLGWLGDPNQTDYMVRVKALRDWMHGFGIGYLLPDGIVHVVPVPIIKGRCIIEGKLL